VSGHAMHGGGVDQVVIDPIIHERWPDYRVLVLIAGPIDWGRIAASSIDAPAPLDLAEAELRARGVEDWTTDPHIAAWMAAFAAFGAKPKRTSPSPFALLKRLQAGLPRIDPVTDLYNSISIRHAMPIGGEDLDRYVGAPRLTVATGEEPFDTMESGEPVTEHPLVGEVIWRDDLGVTCRRWNWRQCVRTRITPETATVLFLLEGMGPDASALVEAAGAELTAGLLALDPAITVASRRY